MNVSTVLGFGMFRHTTLARRSCASMTQLKIVCKLVEWVVLPGTCVLGQVDYHMSTTESKTVQRIA